MKPETQKLIKETLKLKGGRSRLDKSLPFIFSVLDKLYGCSIVDVGCGRGMIGKAIVTEYGAKFSLYGIEVCEDYINMDMMFNYECIYAYDYLDCYKEFNDFDVFLFVDVLEHFSKDDAIEVITYLRNNNKKIIASIPNAPKHWKQDKSFEENNKFEKHLYNWTNEEVKKELGLNLVGENDGVGVYTNVCL